MKKLVYHFISTLCALGCLQQGFAQQTNIETLETLNLEQAIALALENNQALKIVQKQVAIADAQATRGNAGLLPTLNLIGNGNYANNDTELTIRTFLPDPPTQTFDENGVASTTLQGVVQADYQIFAGFRGKYQYKLLENQSNRSKYQQQATIQQTIAEVSTLFLEIAKLQRREELLRETLKITEDRIVRIQDQKAFGKATGLDVLNASTDLNRDRTVLDQVRLQKNTLKRDLNFLIGYVPERRYWVTASYSTAAITDLNQVKSAVRTKNPNVLLAQEGVLAAQNEIGIARSGALPQFGVFANYGYFYQENDVQQLAEITNVGYTVGGRLTLNLFNGGQSKTRVQTAKQRKETTKLEKAQLEDRLVTDAVTQVNRIRILEDQLSREQQNLNTFQQAFVRTEERFKNGKVTNLDIRDAQTALLNAQISISELQADLMIADIFLRTLMGAL
ncbi:MAG: TolC family protein [Bacteroidota bacterium]